MSSLVLAFADYTKDFLLKMDASKEGLGAVLSQKQEDGRFHPVAYGSQALSTHEKNYHSTKLEFLALKWAIMEHFKEYLLYQPFLVYQKGRDNTVADALSWVTTRLLPEAVQAVLDRVAVGTSQHAQSKRPAIIKNEQLHEQEVWVTAGQALVEMHVTNWAEAQKENPELDAVLQWLGSRKKTDLRMFLGECIKSEEGWMVWRNCQNFISLQGTLYLCSTPKGEDEDLLLFVVPKAHRTAALNGCHRDAGHQGHNCTFSLLQECIW